MQIGFTELFHALFNLDKIFIRKGFVAIKVIIKTLFDGGTDGDFDAWEKLFDSLGHEVSGAVPVNLFAGAGLEGMQYQIGILFDKMIKVAELAIYFSANCRVRQAR